MSDYLLVPTNLEALLVGKNDPSQQVYDLLPVPRTKDALRKWYIDAKYAPSFLQSRLKPLEAGVHLHWAVPAALTHARYYENKDREQPCIPNRWLVMRIGRAGGDSQFSSKGWVVESDFLSDTANHEGVPFLFTEGRQFRDAASPAKSMDVKYVGRTQALDGWGETQPAPAFDLKSYGWGDPSFAAYYPACKGVLGFHDSLDGVAPGHLLTYLVIGWYSDENKDPLNPDGKPDTVESCTERLASLLWSCMEVRQDSLVRKTLCHGSVVNIKWQGADQRYPNVAAGSSPPAISIGASADDAFAALLAPQGIAALQRTLRAFHTGQAKEVRDEFQLGEALHQQSFNAAGGGKRWSVEPAKQSLEGSAPPPLLTAKVQDRLGKLNEAQRKLDKRAREVESLRWQLFACWATWAGKQTGPKPGRPARSLVSRAEAALQQAENALRSDEEAVRERKVEVNEALNEQKGMQLVESTMPPFLQPKDPFIAMKGENLTGIDRTRPRRPDKDFEGGQLLHCRHGNEIVGGVSFSGAVSAQKKAAECYTLHFPAQNRLPFGDIAKDLALEALLFDPNHATLAVMQDGLVPDFKELQKTLEQSRQSNASGIEWIGKPPDPLGVTRWSGANPWLPLYLMWQANWSFAHADGSDNKSALNGWALSNDPLGGDLLPDSKTTRMQLEKPKQLAGATLLSGFSGRPLAENLRSFAASEGLRVNSLSGVEEVAVLGQSLGGFNDLLVRQTLGFCLPPVDPNDQNSALIDSAVWSAMGNTPQPTMPSGGSFLPLRAGDLTLVNLYLVDAFGQTRKLIDSNSTLAKTNIIASTEVQPGVGCHASFNPRLIQGARLNFDWPGGAAEAGPLCGWLVPNFLEKSFAVFSASGAPLGALESVLPALGEKTIQSKIKFNWRPAPGSSLGISEIADKPLGNFLELISKFSADEGQAFLELVELVLRKTEERLPPEDPGLAVLLGRPLALVQASIGLELDGLPNGYWTTGDSWKFETQNFENLQVPVRLGRMEMAADGLIGYLQGGAGPLFASDGATRRLGNSGLIEYEQELKVSFADAAPQTLTLLLDASARVHATTGILPRCSIELPPEVGKRISLIEDVYFNVAPVLGARPQANQAPITMPRPSDAFGRWSWATRPALNWREIQSADDRARFPDDLALCEGWLKLRLRPERRSESSQ
jgi:hypothetical protein